MNLSNYLKNEIQSQGRTIKWVSDQLGLNYKTFHGKLNKNTLSATELLSIVNLLDLDILKLKNSVSTMETPLTTYPKRPIRGNTNLMPRRIHK